MIVLSHCPTHLIPPPLFILPLSLSLCNRDRVFICWHQGVICCQTLLASAHPPAGPLAAVFAFLIYIFSLFVYFVQLLSVFAENRDTARTDRHVSEEFYINAVNLNMQPPAPCCTHTCTAKVCSPLLCHAPPSYFHACFHERGKKSREKHSYCLLQSLMKYRSPSSGKKKGGTEVEKERRGSPAVASCRGMRSEGAGGGGQEDDGEDELKEKKGEKRQPLPRQRRSSSSSSFPPPPREIKRCPACRRALRDGALSSAPGGGSGSSSSVVTLLLGPTSSPVLPPPARRRVGGASLTLSLPHRNGRFLRLTLAAPLLPPSLSTPSLPGYRACPSLPLCLSLSVFDVLKLDSQLMWKNCFFFPSHTVAQRDPPLGTHTQTHTRI